MAFWQVEWRIAIMFKTCLVFTWLFGFEKYEDVGST